MDRRTFVKGAFGLVVLAAGAGFGSLTGCSGMRAATVGSVVFTTPSIGEPESAVGPLMMAGIDLLEVTGTDRFAAYYGNTELFDVDKAGAVLVQLADGERTIDAIAEKAAAEGIACEPADVALFFSSLCNAGYLRNRVLVSIAG